MKLTLFLIEKISSTCKHSAYKHIYRHALRSQVGFQLYSFASTRHVAPTSNSLHTLVQVQFLLFFCCLYNMGASREITRIGWAGWESDGALAHYATAKHYSYFTVLISKMWNHA